MMSMKCVLMVGFLIHAIKSFIFKISKHNYRTGGLVVGVSSKSLVVLADLFIKSALEHSVTL